MNPKKLVLSIFVGVAAGLTTALACHSLGMDARGFVLLPLGAGATVGAYFFRTCP